MIDNIMSHMFYRHVRAGGHAICFVVALYFFSLSNIVYGQFSKSITQQNSREVFKQGLRFFYNYYYDLAISKFIQALQKDKDLIIVKKFLGFSLYYSGRVYQAINIWTDLLEKDDFKDPYLFSFVRHLNYSLSGKKLSLFDFDYKYVRTIKPRMNFQYKHLLYLEYLPNGLIALLAHQEGQQGNLILLNSNREYVQNYRKWSQNFIHPTSIHASPSGDLWITDMELEYVHRIPLESVHRKTIFSLFDRGFGSKGVESKQFLGVSSICSMGGYLYIIDYGNNRILKINEHDQDKYYYFPSKDNDYALDGPYGIECMDDDESIYVSEPSKSHLVHLDKYGNFISYLGEKLFEEPRNIQRGHLSKVLLVSDFKKGLFILDVGTKQHRLISEYRVHDKLIQFKNVISATLDPLKNLLIADYGLNSIIELQPEYSIYNTLTILIKKIDVSNYPLIGIFLDAKNSLLESISNLQTKNFTVQENNVIISKINIDYLKSYKDHSSTILLLENTPKVKELEASIRKNMNFVFNKIESTDKIQIVYYNDTQQKATDFISSSRELKISLYNVLNKVEKNNNYSGLSSSLMQGIIDLLSRKGKRSIIWVTTQQFGIDGFANDLSIDRIVQFANVHHINIHVIDYRSKYTTNKKTNWLKQFTKDINGAYYTGYSNQVRGLYSKIQKNINPEILLLYTTELDKQMYKDIYNTIFIQLRTQNKEGATEIGYFLDDQ